jgi:hypothetical protein
VTALPQSRSKAHKEQKKKKKKASTENKGKNSTERKLRLDALNTQMIKPSIAN